MNPKHPIHRAFDALLTWAAYAVYKPLEWAEKVWLRLTHVCTQHTVLDDNGDMSCKVCGRDLTA